MSKATHNSFCSQLYVQVVETKQKNYHKIYLQAKQLHKKNWDTTKHILGKETHHKKEKILKNYELAFENSETVLNLFKYFCILVIKPTGKNHPSELKQTRTIHFFVCMSVSLYYR